MSDRITITRRIPDAGMDVLAGSKATVRTVQEDEERGVSHDEVLEAARGCDVLLCQLTDPIDREALATNPKLLGVAQMAVGFNNIDVEAATELGIPVSNTPGVLTDTTADLTWALLLAVARRIPESHDYMVGGRYKLWGPTLLLGHDVGPGASGRRKVLGIIGYGRIGQAVAKRATGFDMDVIAYDPFNRDGVEQDEIATWADLDELLETSDFVSLHPALTDDTHHMIGEDELRAMKDTACLINVSRGPVVDEKALVQALNEGWIGGAALDVFEDEPEMAPGLSEAPNTVLVPHIGSASRDTRGKMATMAAENALAHLAKEKAPNCVNPEVYDTEAYKERVKG